jgi:hypothetical protein
VAIQEFIIGPQNYFEPGYFNGDYTESNVSRALLQCDIDNIKGGIFVTGEYYVDNYIDGTYYHDNSIRASLACDAMIVQVATVGLTGYYQEGYFTPGYSEQRGSFFVLAADLTRLGEDVFGQGTWESTASMSITVVKTVSVQSSISIEFNQTAVGARGRDIDLFAFTEGQLQSQVTATKSYSLDALSAFDIATDYIRQRSTSSDAVAEFNQSAVNERSRATSMDAQTAFSFVVDFEKLRPFDASLSATAEISCIISHIEGADIVVANFATVTASLTNVSKDAVVNLVTSVSLSILGGKLKTYQAALPVYASVFVSRNAYNRTRIEMEYTSIRQDQAKFGTSSAQLFSASIKTLNYPNQIRAYISDQFVVQGWYRTNNNAIHSGTAMFCGNGTTNQWSVQFESRNASGQLFTKCRLITKNASNQTVEFASNEWEYGTALGAPWTSGNTFNNWHHFAVTKDASNLISFKVNGTTLVSGTISSLGTAPEYRIGWGEIQFGGGSPGPVYWDELSYRKDTSAVDLGALTNDVDKQVFLFHLEEYETDTPIDDNSLPIINHSGNANLSSESTVSASISYVATYQAAISASSSVVAVIGKINEINLVAFDDAELSATATRIKSLASDIVSDISVSADAVKTTATQSNIESVVSQSTTVFALRDAVIITQSVSAQISAVVRLAGLIVDDLCEFNLTSIGVRTASAQSSLQSQSQTAVTAFRIKQLSSALESSATLAVDAVVAKVAAGSFNSNFAQTAAGNRIRFSAMSAAAVSQVSATGNNLGKIECTLFDAVTLSATVNKIAGGATSLPAIATVNATVNRRRNAASAVTSNSAVSVSGQSVITASAILPSIVIQMSVVMEIAGLGSAINVTASMVTTVGVIKSIQASANTSVSVIAIVGYRVTAASAITSASSITFLAGNVLSAQMVITSAMTFTASVREIRIDEIVYVIPGEIFEFEISSETRQYSVGSETRKYIITQGE